MKKRILTMLLVLMASAGVMVGCSQHSIQDADAGGMSIQQSEVIEEDNVEAEDAKPEKTEQEVSEVKGTMDEIKDFMFIVFVALFVLYLSIFLKFAYQYWKVKNRKEK